MHRVNNSLYVEKTRKNEVSVKLPEGLEDPHITILKVGFYVIWLVKYRNQN